MWHLNYFSQDEAQCVLSSCEDEANLKMDIHPVSDAGFLAVLFMWFH